MVDEDDALDADGLQRLKSALLELRYRHKVKYKEIELAIGEELGVISMIMVGRHKPTPAFAQLIYAYAASRDLTLGGEVSDFKRSVSMDMHLDEDKLLEDLPAVEGDYLCYVLNRESIAVSCLTLYRYKPTQQWPEFSSWRKGVLIQGYYYIYERILYLIGHTAETGYPRLMTFWRDPSVHAEDTIGTVALGSESDYSMFSWCYLKRTDAKALRDEGWVKLGQFKANRFEELPADVVAFLGSKSVGGEQKAADI